MNLSTATATKKGKQSPGDYVRILYSKSRVTLHPTPYARDNKPGFLALVLRNELEPGDRGNGSSTSVAQSPPPPTTTTAAASTGSDLAKRNATHVFLVWLSEDVAKQRQETSKFIEMELRGAEGLNNLAGPHLGRRRVAEGVADASTESDDLYVCLPPPEIRNASSEGDVGLEAFSQPLGTIYSVRVTPPTVSNWNGSLTISLLGGRSLPSLFFHDDESQSTLLGMHRATKTEPGTSPFSPSGTTDHGRSPAPQSGSSASSLSSGGAPGVAASWGGEELVKHLRRFSVVHRSVHDQRTYLLNPEKADLEAHSTPVFADNAIDPPNRSAQDSSHFDTSFPDDPFAPTYPIGRSHGNGRAQGGDLTELDTLSSWAKSTRMSLLSHFSHVTRSARDASRQLMEHPVITNAQQHHQQYQRRLAGRIPAAVQSYAHAGPLGPFGPVASSSSKSMEEVAEKAGVSEYDSARVYLAKWARLVAEEGERNRRREELAGEDTGSPRGGASQVEKSGLGIFELLEHPDGHHGGGRSFQPISVTEWNQWVSPGVAAGRPSVSLSDIKRRVFKRGLDSRVRKQAWPVLLGSDVWDATIEEREALRKNKVASWNKLRSIWNSNTFEQGSSTGSDENSAQKMAETLMQRDDIQEQQHRIRVDCLRTDRKMPYFSHRPDEVPQGTSSSDSVRSAGNGRREVGHAESSNRHTTALADILLTYSIYDTLFFDQQSSIPERVSLCCDIPEVQLGRMASGKSVRQSELGGYVQGMSDLCSVLYVACEADASETFWCFVGLMKRMRSNFLASQAGMKAQLLHLQTLVRLCDRGLYDHLDRTDSLNLFFCFRWLLVRFKREFDLEGVQRLWECGWAVEPLESAESEQYVSREEQRLPNDSHPPPPSSATEDNVPQTSHFHLFVCLALLTSHRSVVIDHLRAFDEVLQYFQGLGLGASTASSGGSSTDGGGGIDVETTIQQAAILLRALAEKVQVRERDEEGFAEIATLIGS